MYGSEPVHHNATHEVIISKIYPSTDSQERRGKLNFTSDLTELKNSLAKEPFICLHIKLT